MKITRIKLFVVNVPERHWWWSDDVFGQPEHQRAEHGIAEVETDQGLTGLTQIGRSTPMAAMETMLNAWLGRDVLEVNLADTTLCPDSFRQLVLDLRGQALGVPIWQLQGGRSARPHSGDPVHGIQDSRAHGGRCAVGMGAGVPRL